MMSVHGHLLMKWYYKSAFMWMAQNQTQIKKKEKNFQFCVIFVLVEFSQLANFKAEYIALGLWLQI